MMRDNVNKIFGAQWGVADQNLHHPLKSNSNRRQQIKYKTASGQALT